LFAVLTAAETTNVFQWAKQLPKIPLPMRYVDPHIMMVHQAKASQPQNCIFISASVFAGLTNVTNRQADHATPSVAIGRI